MSVRMRVLMNIYWLAAAIALAGAMALAIWYAPIEATMGPIQKIFYIHLPAAMCMFGACAGVCIGGLGYIWQRDERWDRFALACADAAVVLSTIVLLTGVVWGHHEWNVWWTWSPRLTFSLVLWLLYLVYTIMHRSLASGSRRAMTCALYGIIAFVDVPLVYVSVKLLPDIHPSDVQLQPEMRTTVMACLVPVAMISAGTVVERIVGGRASRHKDGDGPLLPTFAGGRQGGGNHDA